MKFFAVFIKCSKILSFIHINDMLEILITFYKSIIHVIHLYHGTQSVFLPTDENYAKVKASVDILISSTLKLNIIFRL